MLFDRLLCLAALGASLGLPSLALADCANEPCADDAQPASTADAAPSTYGPTAVPLFVQTRHYGTLGASRGALHLGAFEFGARVPTGSPHLSVDIGAAMRFGSYRDPATRNRVGFVGMGVLTDLFFHFNPTDAVRLFVVGGARLSVGGPVAGPDTEDPSELGEDHECPSLATAEASLGFGSDITFGRVGVLSLSMRGVRSRALGTLRFAANGINPPAPPARAVWGIAATLRVGVRFDLVTP